ncbi:MAG: efflux RND transporter permease subunit [Saccharospirillaceae bacterium]|nr:efflux RND transporter permease subunit [Saccharospirillaceae bacterium]MCD8530104.1 efflux RND transporter permease subunit [Saccharospirillaceae bacterium]
MNSFIDASLQRSRTVLMLFCLIALIGITTLITIPKESNPDITVPFVYVSVVHDGISPEDADALIYKPLEKELRSIDGLKEMVSTATSGHLSITLEFYTDVNIDQALLDVRQKVDDAKGELPTDSKEPKVKEINVALFPVMVVTLSGEVNESALYAVAEDLQDRLEALPGVLEATIQGKRDEIAEIIVDPARMDNYNLSFNDLARLVGNNNQLVASEDLDTGAGRFGVKVPGLIENIPDILKLPVKADGDTVVLFQDIAVGRLAYKDRKNAARVNGKPAVTLEIKKRIGSNIIDTLDQVKGIIHEVKPYWPAGIDVGVTQDESVQIQEMLNDLFNNVLVATLLVMILVLGSLGLRSSLMVGMAIPGAFLMALIVLSMTGYTLNMVVLFSLILSVGMLVDGAIVVTEFADRRLAEGANKWQAYSEAAKRMAWPIIASTATTLAVFLPLLFWPGTTGEFMKFLPLTLLYTLSASLIMALIVVPTIGAVMGKDGHHNTGALSAIEAAEQGRFDELKGFTGGYVRLLSKALKYPLQVLGMAIAALISSFVLYGALGHGVEFFPDVDADIGMVDVRARGNLSLLEREALVQQVEKRIFDMAEIQSLYTATFVKAPSDSAADVIGRIQLELVNWEHRRSANQILADIEHRTADIAGIIIETQKKQGGPAAGADIQLQFTAASNEAMVPLLEEVKAIFAADPELKDIRDDRPLEGIEWQLQIDREEATRYGTDIASTGAMIRMITGGQKVGTFQPDFSDDEVEILLRYPLQTRSIDQFEAFNISTPYGLVPVSNFMQRNAVAKSGDIVRIDGKRRYRLTANVTEGVNATEKIQQLSEKIKDLDWRGAGVEPRFRGDFEQMGETGAFLGKAFGIALFLMATILVTQFNSFYQAGLIMSAIILSIVGVLIGLMIRGEPFGIVMSGVGVIALAGIVVNNNIVLIDTYNVLIRQGLNPVDAALRTGAQRLRPVLLTAVTTVVGLLPMVMQWNIDLLNQHFTVGAPSSQWWTQLSTAIAGGLTFATVLTLILTPCLLVLGEKRHLQTREMPVLSENGIKSSV